MARANRGATKCTLNPAYLVVSWILFAVGLWALVAGFTTQFNSGAATAVNTTVLGWYFAGVLLFGIGKWLKWTSHGMCPVHNYCAPMMKK